MYQTQVLSEKYFRIFTGVYNDFRLNCKQDYKFELDPLEYNDFIDYCNKGLLKCILLLEDDIPTAFLAYSCPLNGSIELYVIHCLGDESIAEKRKYLVESFLGNTYEQRLNALVSYPMLGIQTQYENQMRDLGFGFVKLAVVAIDVNDKKVTKELDLMKFPSLPIGYKITSYRDVHFDDLANIVYEAFKDSSDINFDPRFTTKEGCMDIAEKITNSIYGKFLSQCSKVLLHENKVVGFCLANITGESIGNIPLVGILPEHRGLHLSKILLKNVIDDIVKLNKSGFIKLDELNASVDAANTSAVKMYQQVCFKELYTYPQGYLAKRTEN